MHPHLSLSLLLVPRDISSASFIPPPLFLSPIRPMYVCKDGVLSFYERIVLVRIMVPNISGLRTTRRISTAADKQSSLITSTVWTPMQSIQAKLFGAVSTVKDAPLIVWNRVYVPWSQIKHHRLLFSARYISHYKAPPILKISLCLHIYISYIYVGSRYQP